MDDFPEPLGPVMTNTPCSGNSSERFSGPEN